MAEEEEEIISRPFVCKACKKTHMIKLNKRIIEGRSKFPFPYVFLHDNINGVEHKELLTILYIDKNLQIRHSEIQELGTDLIFSKEQVVAMTKPLLEEIELLREELAEARKEISDLKKKK